MMRLDKLLSGCTSYSRSEIKMLIKKGRVRVNESAAKRPEEKADENNDRIYIDGEQVFYKKHLYFMLNKPRGYISASEDGREPTVIDLLPEEYGKFGLFPAGRLDKYTTGLMIITNDGAFAHEALAPGKHVPKTYIAELENELSSDDIAAFREGIHIEGGYLTKPAELEILEPKKARVTIHEGRYHQIKQMFYSRKNKVIELKRISFGGIILPDDLEEGSFRELNELEARAVFGEIAEY